MIASVLSGASRWCVEVGDCREVLAGMPEACVQCCVTSPPYWGLRDYGVAGQFGLEASPEEYVAAMVARVCYLTASALRDAEQAGTRIARAGRSPTARRPGSTSTGGPNTPLWS